MQTEEHVARLIVSCRDRHGSVAAISTTLAQLGANLVSLAQHSSDPENGMFFLTQSLGAVDTLVTRIADVKNRAQMEQLFTEFEGVKKGEVIIGDYNPAVGTTITLNGKQLGSPLPDIGFYNAILRIWIGANPADNMLKPLLLGDKP